RRHRRERGELTALARARASRPPRGGHGQHSAYVNCMLPLAVSHTQRSYAVNGAGEGGNGAESATEARFSESEEPAVASQLPAIGWVPAGQICTHSAP